MVCPVCGKKIENGCICSECGHDESRNVENYLSLVKISGNVKTIAEEIEDYQNGLAEKRLYTLMESRMRNYELQIKKMESQLLEQRRRLEKLEEEKATEKADLKNERAGNSSGRTASHAGGPVRKEQWQKGGIVTFGSYTINGSYAEPVEWQVLDQDEKKILLLSRYGLDIREYNSNSLNTSWENSDLRIWLNGEFYNKAFNSQEKQKIAAVKINDSKWFFNPVLGYSRVDDHVFLLSTEEVRYYLKSDDARKTEPTEFARNAGFKMEYFSKCGKWWLRSQGTRATEAAFVTVNGYVNDSGMDVRTAGVMVRPAIWVIHEV